MKFSSKNMLHLAHLVGYALSEEFGCVIKQQHPHIHEHNLKRGLTTLRRSPRIMGASMNTLTGFRAEKFRKDPKLFLVMHGIDNGAWATLEAQQCLAVLCTTFPGLRLLASIENPNITACWSSTTLTALRWSMLLVPTYEHLKTSYSTHGSSKRELAEGDGLDNVLRSLTSRHTGILSLIAKQQLDQSQSKGILYNNLLDVCRRKMFAQHDRDLRRVSFLIYISIFYLHIL
jgi:hypothetical protein